MKSYAYWPVKLKGIDGEFHITAAWFGDYPFNTVELNRLLADQLTTFQQVPGIVHVEFNRRTHVLELRATEATHAVHKILTTVRPHDYPEWKPHVTVPYDYWAKTLILPNSHDLIEAIGPLSIKAKTAKGSYFWIYKKGLGFVQTTAEPSVT